MKPTTPAMIRKRASASGFLPLSRRAADHGHDRRRETARQHREPGLGGREAEHPLREQRKEERAAVQTEAEHDEQEDRRRRDRGSCSTRKLMTGCLFALRQLPPDHRITSEIAETEREADDQRVVNQSLRLPSSSTYWSEPTPTISSPMPSQSTGLMRRCARADRAGTSSRGRSTTMPIGMLMKKHQFQV